MGHGSENAIEGFSSQWQWPFFFLVESYLKILRAAVFSYLGAGVSPPSL